MWLFDSGYWTITWCGGWWMTSRQTSLYSSGKLMRDSHWYIQVICVHVLGLSEYIAEIWCFYRRTHDNVFWYCLSSCITFRYYCAFPLYGPLYRRYINTRTMDLALICDQNKMPDFCNRVCLCLCIPIMLFPSEKKMHFPLFDFMPCKNWACLSPQSDVCRGVSKNSARDLNSHMKRTPGWILTYEIWSYFDKAFLIYM